MRGSEVDKKDSRGGNSLEKESIRGFGYSEVADCGREGDHWVLSFLLKKPRRGLGPLYNRRELREGERGVRPFPFSSLGGL
jgi:hypothetical protein